MSFMGIVHGAAVLAAGLLGGIFLAHLAGPRYALAKLSASAFIQYQQIVHKYYVRFMPVLQLLASLGALTWLYELRTNPESPAFILIAISAVGTIAMFALTVAINVPINKKLMTWNAASPPQNLADIWRPWERVNTIRTTIAISACILELVVLNSGM